MFSETVGWSKIYLVTQYMCSKEQTGILYFFFLRNEYLVYTKILQKTLDLIELYNYEYLITYTMMLILESEWILYVIYYTAKPV